MQSRRRYASSKTTVSAIALSLGFSGLAGAQEDPGEPTFLPGAIAEGETVLAPIVVTGNRRATELQDVPRSILTFDAETLEQQYDQNTNLSTVLPKIIPGFGAPLFNNSTRGLTLRGREPLFLLDGVPISSGDFAVGLNAIDALIIEGIEVLYGPTALYGDGATGGVIQFFSLEPSAEPFTASLRAGFDTYINGHDNAEDGLSYNVQGVASGTRENLGYVLSLSFDRQGGFFQPDGQRIAPSRNDDYNNLGVFTKLRYSVDETRGVEAFVSYAQSEPWRTDFRGVASGEGSNQTGVAERNPQFFANTPEQTTLIASLSYFDDDLAGGEFKFQTWYRDEDLSQGAGDIRPLIQFGLAPPTWPALFQTNNDDEAFGVRLDYGKDLSDRLAINFGADFQRDDDKNPVIVSDVDVYEASGERFFNATGTLQQVAPNTIDAYGAFIQAQYRATDRLTVSGGLRYDYFEYDFEPVEPAFGIPAGLRPGGSGTASGTNFNIGVSYQLTPNTTTFASFAQGFSLPDLAAANNQLEPGIPLTLSEFARPLRVNSYEIGVRGDVGPVSYSAAAFLTTSEFGEDIVILPGTGQGDLVRAPQRNYGFEIATNTAVTDDIDLGVAVSWNDGDIDREDSIGTDPIGNLTAQPLKILVNGIWRATDRLTFNGDVLYIGDRSRSERAGLEDFSIDGYTVVDAGLTYVLGPGDLSVQITNLFNTEYIPVASQSSFGVQFARRFAGPGRRLVVNYTAQF